jgi:N-methylhydantoinase A
MALPSAVISEIEPIIADLHRRCVVWFAQASIATDDRRVSLSVDMRYAGQNYELSVPLPPGPVTRATLDGLASGFAAAHQRRYGFVAEDEPMQLARLIHQAGVRTHNRCRMQRDGLEPLATVGRGSPAVPR